MDDWKPVNAISAWCVLVVNVVIAWLYIESPQHWIRILDDANLVFHEAGHPLFGILGPTWGLFGGTLGQLAFPFIACCIFWNRLEPVSLALSSTWLFENFLNISRYMADAQAQVLPLVGGGEHDWATIFARWGVLPHCIWIAGFVGAIGYLGLLASTLWLLYRSMES